MCYLIWGKAHRSFANRKVHAPEFFVMQLCDMLSGTGGEDQYGGPWMGWGGEEESEFSFVGGDVEVR